MKTNSIKGIVPLALLAVIVQLIACHPNFENSSSAFLQYANNSVNGLVQKQSYQDIDMKLKLIPSSYFLLRDIETATTSRDHFEELKMDYENSLYLLLSIRPRISSDRIIDRNTFGLEEFKRKTQGLNFNLEQLFSLNINGDQYYPVLSSLQNVYELDGGKSILLAFNLEDKIQSDVVAHFDDQIFTAETFEFKFLKKHIDNIPQIEYEDL